MPAGSLAALHEQLALLRALADRRDLEAASEQLIELARLVAGDPQARAALQQLLLDPAADVRDRGIAALVLGRLVDPVSTQLLLDVLEHDPEESVRELAAMGLSHGRDPLVLEVDDLLVHRLGLPAAVGRIVEDDVRQALVQLALNEPRLGFVALGALAGSAREPEVIDAALRVAADERRPLEQRLMALQLLRRSEGAGGEHAPILALARSPGDERLRAGAVRALGTVPAPQALQALFEFGGDASAAVREAVAIALYEQARRTADAPTREAIHRALVPARDRSDADAQRARPRPAGAGAARPAERALSRCGSKCERTGAGARPPLRVRGARKTAAPAPAVCHCAGCALDGPAPACAPARSAAVAGGADRFLAPFAQAFLAPSAAAGALDAGDGAQPALVLLGVDVLRRALFESPRQRRDPVDRQEPYPHDAPVEPDLIEPAHHGELLAPAPFRPAAPTERHQVRERDHREGIAALLLGRLVDPVSTQPPLDGLEARAGAKRAPTGGTLGARPWRG
ncbi:MAG: hypothetical protein KatS3mg102_2676 [Planctomycetota bacterium]|nr:MAG: hypothetical protein KatS3mg102_2676 [Planctomycetota bacterium]